MPEEDSEQFVLPNISPTKANKVILNNFGVKRLTNRRIQMFETASNSLERRRSVENNSVERQSDVEHKGNSISALSPIKFEREKFESLSPSKLLRPIEMTKMPKLPSSFTINTIHARLERSTLIELCRQNGWREVRNKFNANLIWYGCHLRDIDCKILAFKNCFFNRYPKANIICRKKQFHLLLKKYQRFFLDEYDFVPDSYVLPEEYRRFRKMFDRRPDKTFLAKPSKGKGGDGIFFIKSMRDVPRLDLKGNDIIAQEYIKDPLLVDKKKFDLRLYLLITGVDNMQAYVADEGIARFCTEEYEDPKIAAEDEKEDQKLYSHLTNYCLNIKNEKFVNNEDFKTNDTGSKRLLSTIYHILKSQGASLPDFKAQIDDICTKIVLALQPILINSFHTEMGTGKECNQKCFHIFGVDILVDSEFKCWLMEINACPSLSFITEKEYYDEDDIPCSKKVVSELDKFFKPLLLKEAISIITENPGKDGTFRKIFPPENAEKYKQFTVYNDARVVFEMLAGFRKPDSLNCSQFTKICSFPGMKCDVLGKPEYEIIHQMYKKKGTKNFMNFEGFIGALEEVGKYLFEGKTRLERLKGVIKTVLDYAMEFNN